MGVIDIKFLNLKTKHRISGFEASRLTTVIVSYRSQIIDLNFNFFIDTRAFFKIKILIVNTIFITRKRMNIEII
jgi:hypothetical protein